MPREVNELYESFKADRIITIFVDDCHEPIYLSQNLLTRNSPFFERLLLPDGERPWSGHEVLSFPEDSLDAWKWMLFWMTQKRVPDCYEMVEEEDSDPAHLIRCWCLGDKYEMLLFQDAVMEQLLYRLQTMCNFPLDAIKVAFETSTPGTVVTKLMMEGLVYMLPSGDISFGHLDTLDGVPGFTAILAEALQRESFTDFKYGVDHCWLACLLNNREYYMLCHDEGLQPSELTESECELPSTW